MCCVPCTGLCTGRSSKLTRRTLDISFILVAFFCFLALTQSLRLVSARLCIQVASLNTAREFNLTLCILLQCETRHREGSLLEF